MITDWYYDARDSSRGRKEVKEYIKKEGLKAIDVGAGIAYWSYPECKVVADILPKDQYKDSVDDIVEVFEIDLQRPETWWQLLDFVTINGKFDFSICSHTLEDIYNPIEVMKLLEKISKQGFIATPSKYEECTHLYGHPYRGNPHHKFIFDVKYGVLQVLPKSSFIENDSRSDILASGYSKGIQLSLWWKNSIEYKLFGDVPIHGDEALISQYYNILLDEERT